MSEENLPNGQEQQFESKAASEPNSSYFRNTIVFSPKKNVRAAVKEALEKLDVDNLITPTEIGEMLDTISRHLQTPIVIDWAVGAKEVVAVLTKVRQSGFSDARPILLLAQNLNEEIAAIAMEYNVSRIFGGKLQADEILANLSSLKASDTTDSELNDTLKQITLFRDQGEFDQALQLGSKLYEKHPKNMRIVVEYAELLIERGQWQDAEVILHPLWTLDPPYLRALSAYGRCLLHKGNYQDAEKVLAKGNMINPYNVERLVLMGQVLLNQDKLAEAEAQFDEAMDLEKDNQEALAGKATCKLISSDVNEALAFLKEIAKGRELAAIFNSAAIFSIREERFDHGLSLYDIGINLVGHDQSAQSKLYFNRGIAYFKMGRRDEALRCFEQACQTDPNFAKAKFNLKALTNNPKDTAPVYDTIIADNPQAAGDFTTDFDAPGEKIDLLHEFDEESIVKRSIQ